MQSFRDERQVEDLFAREIGEDIRKELQNFHAIGLKPVSVDIFVSFPLLSSSISVEDVHETKSS